MFNKKAILIILFFAFLFSARGQQLEIRPKIGIGTYSMSELKRLLEQSVSDSPFELKTTEKFPEYVFYGLDVIQSITPKFGLGISSGFYSTGGRNHYADYSGSYREDIKVNALNLGILVSYKDSLPCSFFYGFQLASGIKFSNISLDDELKLFDNNEVSAYDFKSKGWWVEPQLRIGKYLYKNISVSVFTGYEINFKSKIVSKENSQNYLTSKIDWSGVRAGISVSYSLNL